MGSTREHRPGVTFVMPVYNEAGYVEAAIHSVLSQHYEGPVELVVALAPSTDGTDEIVRDLAGSDERIHVVDNPGRDIPIGLNRAIEAARHPIVVRVDAHSALAPDYTSSAVRTLERTGAANVGGIMSAVGRPGVQAAVARGYNSRLGLGGGAYHAAHAVEGPAESAYLGVMRADVVRSIGGFDESLRRGEDWELNFRLRAAGHLVWLDPALSVTYWPRDTWGGLARQFLATGTWRGELGRRLGTRNPARFLAPPALVVALVLSIVVGLLQLTGVLSGWPSRIASIVHVGPAVYLLVIAGAALSGGGSILDRLRYAGVLATMHVSWGTGFLIGMLRGAGHAVDTSRTRPSKSRS
jgi:succinoglycan biosynthesis protein ExoA